LSEVEYAAKIHAAINQLPAHSKAFLAVDELFEGTVAQTGSKALYDFAKKLADNDHLLFVIATQHQIEPTRLEQATDGVIKNYKVDVIRLTDGTIVRPYKLEEGVSQVNIGDDLLQAAFNQTR
jgi:DNA mismatch repair ATPase MutS